MRLTGSVGERGRNLAADVTYVQILLSDWLLSKGKLAIAIDGIAGPKTIGAIRLFQQSNTAVVDGLVEPNRSTIKALERCHMEVLRSSISLSPYLAAARNRGNFGVTR